MPCINADTVDFWKQLAADLSKTRPYAGRRVRSTTTRGKNKGKTGVVIRHERDKYDISAWRYGGDANLHMRDMAGTYGFACKVRWDDGSVGWISAMKVECLDEV